MSHPPISLRLGLNPSSASLRTSLSRRIWILESHTRRYDEAVELPEGAADSLQPADYPIVIQKMI